MRNYTQITPKERRQIYAFLEMKVSRAEIARRLDRHRSTIYREMNRNREEGMYYPGMAHEKAIQRRTKERLCKIQRDQQLYNYFVGHLKEGWSPEQIAGRIKKEKQEYYACHETFYRYIYRSKNKGLYKYLPYKKTRRSEHFGRKLRRCRYGEIRLIKERPSVIETREKFGHWEGDSIIFSKTRKQSVLTAVERKSRMALLFKNDRVDSETVIGNLEKFFIQQPKKTFLSITFDQGSEFANYRQLEIATKCRVYYCETHSPWQKGSNENLNGRIRRYLPRETDIERMTQEELNQLARRLNNTPRKCLGYQTPKELYLQHCKPFSKLIL